MSDGKNNDDAPPPDDQRTIFIAPQKGGATPDAEEPTESDPWGYADQYGAGAQDESEPASAGWDDPDATDQSFEEESSPQEDATQFEPRPEQGSSGWAAEPTPPPEPRVSEPPPRIMTTPPLAPRQNAQGIQVGDVLNHIFEVKRFIARGGMGEVFEGCNVNSDEKVAIKVMLPSLAADPNVISMFRREARALTRLQHEALVQYRVLAQEPQLGVLYIVTEFVDGQPLSDLLGKISPSGPELEGLLRRLAAGLRAAHALGVLHRDMSPDNVLLEEGNLARAKIIDFGIAKDLDPGSATIVGDGFAGKLSYVAPEQLGDFGREVGPWSDVYSLALVILAVAMGRDVQMGGTLVDAVDKRRAGPDLSPIPESIRPVLEMMLRPNPAERLRSMDEVLRALDQNGSGAAVAAAGGGAADDRPKGLAGVPKPALIGGAAGLALLAAAGIWMMSSGDGDGNVAGVGPGGSTSVGAPGDPVQAARQAIDAAVPSVPCSWLDIVNVGRENDQLTVALGGVAGAPTKAQNEIVSALGAAGVQNAHTDVSRVATIRPAGCSAIDVYKQFRNTEAARLSTEQRVWEMRMQGPGEPYAGQEAARIVARMNIGDPSTDLTLFAIDPAGIITPFLERIGGKKTAYFDPAEPPAQSWDDAPITETGTDSYTIELDLDHEGWSGLVLMTGKGPFPRELVQPGLGARNSEWRQQFERAAARQGWQTDMTWFKSTNQRPGD